MATMVRVGGMDILSKWRDKVDIAGETVDEGEITSPNNFGTYRRMCGFGGGECRSVIRTLHEKRMEYRLNKYKEIEENTKICITGTR